MASGILKGHNKYLPDQTTIRINGVTPGDKPSGYYHQTLKASLELELDVPDMSAVTEAPQILEQMFHLDSRMNRFDSLVKAKVTVTY